MDELEQINLQLDAMKRWDEYGVPPAASTELYIDEILSRWIPAARRLGMYSEQTQLQHLAVKLGFPEDYERLERLLEERRQDCEIVFRTFALPIREMLDKLGIEYEFKYRMKSIYSVWRKMRVDHKSFDDVYDIFATRIVYKPQFPRLLTDVSTLAPDAEIAAAMQDIILATDPEHLTCWRIYAVIAMLYPIQAERIKNWVSHPKLSGYQALQLTVKGPEGNMIEVQIRSERMDYEAEYGSAAHWLYKQQTNPAVFRR